MRLRRRRHLRLDVDVVVNEQMFGDKEKASQRLKTTLEEKLQSLNEQMGDRFKERAHGTPAYGACKASKYAHRFFTVAQDACDALHACAPEVGAAEVALLQVRLAEGAAREVGALEIAVERCHSAAAGCRRAAH